MRSQIRSPKTNRLIYVGGETYNNLIGEYTSEYLKSLENVHKLDLTGVNDTDTLILLNLEGEDLLNACQINKRINQLCKNKLLSDKINNYIKLNQKKFNTMKYRIGRAILSGDKKGLSRQSIKKYLAANYKIDSNDPWINFTIFILTNQEKGLIINRHHQGHFKLSTELRKFVENQ